MIKTKKAICIISQSVKLAIAKKWARIALLMLCKYYRVLELEPRRTLQLQRPTESRSMNHVYDIFRIDPVVARSQRPETIYAFIDVS